MSKSTAAQSSGSQWTRMRSRMTNESADRGGNLREAKAEDDREKDRQVGERVHWSLPNEILA